jgi:spore maturation protein CgeB
MIPTREHMKIIYSFNKNGYEGKCWQSEIVAASSNEVTFVPFNHGVYLDPNLYDQAYRLDRIYQSRDPRLRQMYEDFVALISSTHADAILVNNCPPYHPEFLRKLTVYRALYSGDDPVSTYMRNIPYLHAYQHVFFASPSYSPDMDMEAKMRYCGMVNTDWLPIGVFDYEYDPRQTEETILSGPRDIDIIYIGKFWQQKVETLTQVRRAFGRRFHMYGFFRLRHNIYFNFVAGYGGWIRPLSFVQRVRYYQRAKIGLNIHWSNYALGNQRLYHLPANGVMQISDSAEYLGRGFAVGSEVESYDSTDELIDKLRFYVSHDEDREAIALSGYRRTMRDYRLSELLRRAATFIQQGMERIGWVPGQIYEQLAHQTNDP